MAKKEETSKPTEKPEGETPAEKEASAEQPETVQESPGSKEIDKDARMWAMICHLAALAGLVVPVVGCIIGPLVVWQIKKEEFPFVDEQGKEAVNFQISILIYGIVAGLLCFACVGIILLPAVVIFDLIFMLIAAVKANNGEHYRYPLTIRFIK
ncbi:MAG: DUF4870 domain-containing protein [Planctomycetes bacterium]|nr:DUF4870 domain-containing protein [Planctomycetota bacterium]